MAGKAGKLQRAGEAEAVTVDRLILNFESELSRILRLVERTIVALVRDLAEEDGRLVRTRASLGRALRLRKDLIGAFTDAGYRELAEAAIDDDLDDLTALVLEHSGIAGKAARLTNVNAQAVLAYKELRLADLLDWQEDTARILWRTTLDGVLGLRPVPALVRDIGAQLDLSLPRARTIYDTAVSTYSRQVNLLQSTGDDGELFYYAGPVDDVTRKFCLDRVGKVFSRSEIDKMDNGQIPNCLISGGGYNCRHAFKQVSILDDELRQLHETGERLPHVQAQVDALLKRKAA